MKWVLLFLSVFFVSAATHAQVQVNWDSVVVKDESGRIYKTAEWQGMLTTSRYEFRLAQDLKTALLVRLSDEEMGRRIAALPKPAPSHYFTTGQKVKPFADKDLKGNRYDLSRLAGKVVVINFWFINCPPCRQEIPGLNEMVASYKDNKDIVFLAIALDPPGAVSDFVKGYPFNYNLIGNGGYIAQQYGVTNYPTHLVLDKEGKVAFHTTGVSVATVPWVKKSIDAVLAGTVLP